MNILTLLPVTFASELTDDELKGLVIGRILGEDKFPESEAAFDKVVARIRQEFPSMGTGSAYSCARIAIDTEAGIRWMRLLEGK